MSDRYGPGSARLCRPAPGGDGAASRACAFAAALLLLFVSAVSAPSYAQGRRAQPARKSQPAKKQPTAKQMADERKQAADDLARLRDEFVRLTGEYKKSLGDLMKFREKDVRQAEDRLAKVKSLYAEGLVAKRDVEAGEKTVADARARAAETEQQMKAADAQVAETLLEAEADEEAEKLAARSPSKQLPKGRLTQIGTYLRFTGAGYWSISNAWKVQQFYAQQFGRQLPVSAFGQTALHNRLGFDHRNSVDVPLHPNGAEGQALMAFLRANGIPFTAFTAAIPGSATGPHIHVGAPSRRIKPSN